MLGFDIGVGLKQRPTRLLPSLMPPQTVMLVAGDSLGAQASNGSNHALLWANCKGRIDVDYHHRAHNISVGTTSSGTDATLIPVTSPAGANVRRGLNHPERLARDTGYVVSTGAKVLLLEVGTNDSSGTLTPTQILANVQSYVAAMKAAGIERVILGTIQPRMSSTSTPTVYMGASSAERCRGYNAALIDWADSDPSIFVYDGSGGELDPVHAAAYGPIGGGSNSLFGASTYDGVHWGNGHAARREDELLAVLQQMFPARALRPYSTGDVYSYASNRHANALGAQAGFSGPGARNPATASGGPSGSFGAGWIGNTGGAIPAGATVAGAEAGVDYEGAPRSAIRVTFGGTPSADFSFRLQKLSNVSIGTDADTKLRMNGTEKVLHEWVVECGHLSGCNRFSLADVSTGIAELAVGGPGQGGSAGLPVLDGRYVMRLPSVGPAMSAAGSCIPAFVLEFKAGVPISGSITFIHAFLGHVA